MKKLFTKTTIWVKNHKLEFALLFLILLVGAFLRLYRISDYMMFLGDEGRDAIIVRKLLVDGDLVFVGPGTSVGNMYLGPLYYYLIAPSLFIAGYSPVGPSIMVALIGIATIFLVWFIAREWFPQKDDKSPNIGAFVAAGLYAVSPVVTIYSKSSWNPNVMPFFALVTIYSLWKIWSKHNWFWIFVLGVSFAFVTQSHYLGVLLVPVILVYWFLSFRKSLTIPKEKVQALRCSLASIFVFILLSLPLVLFDAKYKWRNFIAIREFILERQSGVTFSLSSIISKVYPIYQNMITRLLAGTSISLGFISSILLLLLIIYGIYLYIFKKRVDRGKNGFILLTSWILTGILGLTLYKGVIYDHYLGFLFPAPFLLAAWILNIKVPKVYQLLLISFFGVLLGYSLYHTPLRNPPNKQMQRSIDVARKIEVESSGQKFNLAVIADKNYEGAYQYFLEAWNLPISQIDPQRYQDTVADQLFVVCEYEDQSKCQPASNPKTEVANFGWSKVEKYWNIDGVVLYKLVHNPEGK